MGNGRDPRKMFFTTSIDREEYAKFLQKIERLGLKRNDVLCELITNYSAGEELSEEKRSWIAQETQKILDKRGWNWDRIKDKYYRGQDRVKRARKTFWKGKPVKPPKDPSVE